LHAHQNHGLEIEASLMVLDFFFDQKNATSILIRTTLQNHAALQVIETLPAQYQDPLKLQQSLNQSRHASVGIMSFRLDRPAYLHWSQNFRRFYNSSNFRPKYGVEQAIGQTPLVELKNISRSLPVPIFAKCEFQNPGGSVKDRIAASIIEDAERRGLLKPGMTVIEATAGNTGLGLAIICAQRGYSLVCVMPEKMCEDKVKALTLLGVKIVRTPNAPPSDPQNFRQVAERLTKEHGWFSTDQFSNIANISAHYTRTGPEILRQMSFDLGAFVTGAGTGGTISGVGSYLKQRVDGIKIVLADPHGSGLAEWVKSGTYGADAPYLIEGIGGSIAPENLWRHVIDDAVSVSDKESFTAVQRLLREEGLLVGGSAGSNLAAATKLSKSGLIKKPIVTILPDSWDRYWSRPWLNESI
jgi:cysteine synthase